MYKKIIVPLDGSELAECVLPHLETITGCSVGEVVFVRVVEPVHSPFGTGTDGGAVYTEEEAKIARESQDARDREEAREYLDAVMKKVNLGGAQMQAQVLTGNAADTLVDYLKKSDADLTLIASHGRSGISRWVYGSVADRLLRGACTPVMMIRAPGCVPGM